MTGRRGVRFAVLAALALAAAPAGAHNVAPQPIRELVRIQGYKAPAPRGVEVDREVVLVVLGQPLHFAANEWRTFGFFDPTAQPTPAEPSEFALQGDRADLHRISTARPEQRITVLAERRPGASNLFVLAVDLCPAQ